MRTSTIHNAANRPKLQHLKGNDSRGFSGMCPEQQEEDDDEVLCYQLAMLYDQYNYRNRKCAQLKGGTN